MLYNVEGELDPATDAVAISSAKVRRPGKDVTVVTYGGSLFKTLNAAATLAQDGIEAEVIDLRSLRPLEMGMMVESVAKMRRILIVDEVWKSGSISPEIAMRLIETGVLRVRRADPSGVQRRSADALCSASRATGFAPAGGDCGHRADPVRPA
jgi:pyruvate/2-oxoglutarate/acetoin dehydrogenase E1 component